MNDALFGENEEPENNEQNHNIDNDNTTSKDIKIATNELKSISSPILNKKYESKYLIF